MASRHTAHPAGSARRLIDSRTDLPVTWIESSRVYVNDHGEVVPSARVREVVAQTASTAQNVVSARESRCDEASRSAPRRPGDDQPRQGTSNDKGKQPLRQDERRSDQRQPPARSEPRRESNTSQQRPGQEPRRGNVVTGNTVAAHQAAPSNPQQPVVRFQSPNTAADSSRTLLSSILSGDARPRVFTATDPVNDATTYWEVTAYQLSDNTTGSQHSFKRIRESNGSTAPNRIGGRPNARPLEEHFTPYTVAEVMLVPPPDHASSTITRFTPLRNQPRGLLRPRLFVIIEQRHQGRNSFLAVAIKTYSFQGVAAEGVIKAHHAIIYTQSGKHKQKGPHPRDPPEATTGEMPRQLPGGYLETGMQSPPIRVKQVDMKKKLDPMSRIDYCDRWEFDYGVPNIRVWGHVHRDSRAEFRLQYEGVWAAINRSATGPIPPLPGSITLPLRQYPGAGVGMPDQRGQGSGQPARDSAVAGPSRDTRAATPRTSTTAVSGAPVFQVPIHARPNSGPISEKQCTALLQQYRERAVMVGFTPPSATGATIQQLAGDSRARADFLTRVMDRWHQEAAQRQARQQPAPAQAAAQQQVRPQPAPARQGRGNSSSESGEYTDDDDDDYYYDRTTSK